MPSEPRLLDGVEESYRELLLDLHSMLLAETGAVRDCLLACDGRQMSAHILLSAGHLHGRPRQLVQTQEEEDIATAYS